MTNTKRSYMLTYTLPLFPNFSAKIRLFVRLGRHTIIDIELCAAKEKFNRQVKYI